MAGVPHFRIETLEDRSGSTIKVGGELDSASWEELLDRFEQAARADGAGQVVLDLSEVTFVDSSGMRAIIMIERAAVERGVELTVVPPPAALTELFQMAGIADHLALAPVAAETTSSPPRQFVERIELDLTPERTAPGRARAELREALGDRLSRSDRDTVTLLTSEVVTNAVIHPEQGRGDPVELVVTVYPRSVRIEVTDAGLGFDTARLPGPRREAGGHGLVVVDSLSSRWGTSRGAHGGTGFSVWFELDVDYDLSGASAADEQAGPAEQSLAAEG